MQNGEPKVSENFVRNASAVVARLDVKSEDQTPSLVRWFVSSAKWHLTCRIGGAGCARLGGLVTSAAMISGAGEVGAFFEGLALQKRRGKIRP